MKVLFILEYYYPHIGGVETLFQSLAVRLVQNGHQVRVLSMRYQKSLEKYEKVKGVEIIRLPFNSRLSFALFSVFRVIREAGDADIIHTTSSSGGFPAVLAAKLRRKKVIVTFHELWGKLWFSLPFINPLTRMINYIAEQIIAHLPYSRIVAVSDATRSSLIDSGISEKKIVRIYNGLDYSLFSEFRHRPAGDFTFCYFGRLGVSKGLDLLLPAAKMFFDKHPSSRFKLIIPSEPKHMLNKVLSMIASLGIGQQVDVFHHLEKKALFTEISSSHAVVIPSYTEGFGFSAAEAIALGVPVISSGQKSLKEVVSGKFVQMKKQDVSSLLEALEKASKDEWQYLPVKKFKLQDQVQKYEKLYDEL